MAATRKLQGEIDRCLKKVTEGVETFEDIWQKVHNATNSNQKEKYEADLKKEIKKLQRLRDQIKSWIASGEIKDKTSLLDNRRLIETQMERFKVVERETKTKAYSKEGLGAAQKLDPAQREKESVCCWLQNSISSLQIQTDQYESEIESLLANKKKRLDKEKQDKMDDLKSKLDRHKFHITKLETLLRMLDNDSVDVEQIRKIRDDVEYYIDSSQEPDFEENEFIYDDIEGLDEVELSDLVAGTTESNNSNETGDSPTSSASTSPINSPVLNCSAPTTTSSTTNTTSKQHNHSSGSTSVDYTDLKKNKVSENSITKLTMVLQPVKPTAVKPKIENNNLLLPTTTSLNNNNNTSTASSVAASINPSTKPLITSTPSKNQQSAAQILANNTNNNSIQSPSTILPTPIAFSAVAKQNPVATLENGPMSMILSGQSSAPTAAPTLVNNVSSASSIQLQHASGVHNSTNNSSNVMSNNAAIENHMNNNSSSLSNCVSPTSQSVALSSSRTSPTSLLSPQQQQQQQQQQQVLNGPSSQKQAPVTSQANTVSHSSTDPSNESTSTLKTIAQEVVNRTINMNLVPTPPIQNQNQNQNQQQQQQPPQQQQQQSYVMDGTSIDPSSTANINSLISATSSTVTTKTTGTNEALIPPLLGVAPLGPSPLQKDHQQQFQMMEAAYYHLPSASDSERLKPYLQRQPVATPPHYPQTQLPHSDTIDFFQRLATETLFFVFYYMEGTKAQYLAAKALKKQSWRFHTKYMMWFQRHEEPKIINEEFEQGTYIYFDYEKWGQRKKEGFTFEYKYLEDKDLN
ncbi:hypothetical protein ACKWTF_005960 [Chironomus riparius]